MTVDSQFIINLNDTVEVTLTDAGREILRRRNAEFSSKYPHSGILHGDAESETMRTQLWYLFAVFGAEISMVGPLPFAADIRLVR